MINIYKNCRSKTRRVLYKMGPIPRVLKGNETEYVIKFTQDWMSKNKIV